MEATAAANKRRDRPRTWRCVGALVGNVLLASLGMQQCVLDALIGPSGSAHAGDRYLVYGPPLGLNDQAVALRNALA